jgi:hypothetical protein
LPTGCKIIGGAQGPVRKLPWAEQRYQSFSEVVFELSRRKRNGPESTASVPLHAVSNFAVAADEQTDLVRSNQNQS